MHNTMHLTVFLQGLQPVSVVSLHLVYFLSSGSFSLSMEDIECCYSGLI